MTTTINNEPKKLNVPNLRFPEFKGEWDTVFLGDIVKSITSGKSKSSKGEYNLYGSTGIIGKTQKPDYEGGMLLIARVGANAGYLQLINEQCGITDNTLIVIPTDVSTRYLYYFLQHFNLNRLVFGSGQPLITGGMLKKIKVRIGTKKEQDEISNFLSLLDERIATQNKIIDKLQSLIKGLRHKLFESIIGDVTTLSEIANIYQPQTISSIELTKFGYNVYGANGIIGKYHTYNHENEQVCITCRGNTCGTVNYTLPKSWITGNAMVINSDEFSSIIDKRYLYHYLCSMNFSSIISGSGQPQIVRSPLEKLRIVLPTMRVQQKVALWLDSILCKTRTEEAIVMCLEEQRQYLLRQMFI